MSAKRAAEGLTVITVGCILLANSLGFLSWGVWWSIASLWPLLVVSLGLEVLGKSLDNGALRVFSSLVVIGGLLVGALVLPDSSPRWYARAWFSGDAEPFSFSENHVPGVREGRAEVSTDAGEVRFSAGSELASAEGETPFPAPSFEAEIADGVARVDIKTGGGGGRGPTTLDVTLDEAVDWELRLESGAVSLEADLSELDVSRLDIRSGASDLDITFGRLARHAEARIRAGVSSILIRVPEDLGVELRTRSGLVSIDVPAGFGRERGDGGSIWRSASFDRSRRTLEIAIDAGISDVEVVTY